MLLSLFLTCAIALGLATAFLLTLGHRTRFASRLAGLGLTAAFAVAAGVIASSVWSLPSGSVEGAVGLLAGFGILIAGTRGSVWNPIGQAFFAAFLASAVAYLIFGIDTTFQHGLTPEARAASGLLFLLELAALTLSASFTFESCDAVCRTRHTRRIRPPDPNYVPMVSVQLATYNEPPDMLIETIQTLEQLDYPNYEIVVIDNNTKDPDIWRPVAEYCESKRQITFVHVDPWPGFKSGALNLALERHTHPDADIIGIVDSDYRIERNWLRELVGYFVDPKVAFVQSPQDYREYEHDSYLRACYDAYKYFFSTTMPFRNERNSIIFAGTMGLVRRSTLEKVGGWDEWCITEDAELSLRMLKAGYDGVYVPQSYGRGIMPLTFASLKSQRFRWCFGGMQIFRRHWRDLAPGKRTVTNQLSLAQRVDYFFGVVQWMNDLVYFAFTLVLIASGIVLLNRGPLGLRPLYGAAVLLPSALILSGVVRALWALRVKTGIGLRRAVLAFFNWLSLSWTVTLACVQGLTRPEGAFLRTPKTGERNRLLAALWSARAETFWATVLWAIAVFVALRGRATPFVLALFAWQGVVYASALYMSWLNQHTELSAQLERRRRTEWLRERSAIIAPVSIGALVAAGAAAAVVLIIGVGGSHPGKPSNPFALPQSGTGSKGPGQPTQPAPAQNTPSSTPRSSTPTTVPTSSTSAPSSSTTSPSGSTTTTGP